MKSTFLLFAVVSGLVMVAQPAWAAKPAKCQDIPVRVTLYNYAVTDPPTGATTPSALRSDGGGEYTTASIKICSGTTDVVTTTGSRMFTYVFPSPIPGSIIEAVPAWVPGTYAVSGSIVIHNILYSKEPFATMAGSFFKLSGGRVSYRLGFKGLSPDLPNAPNMEDGGHTPGDNIPFPSSPVVVFPTYPFPCGPGNMPRWLVQATSPNFPDQDTKMEVGTLHTEGNSRNPDGVHQGQYSMPFEMMIEAMQCFAY
jgi:hypothetical protein